MLNKDIFRFNRRKMRTRSKVKESNKGNRLRIVVSKSNKNFYAQLLALDGNVEVSCSSLSGSIKDKLKGKKGTEIAEIVGEAFGELAVKKGVKEVVFDKGPHRYFGRVKAFADACRKAGLVF